MDFSFYSLRLVFLVSHACVDPSIFFGDTFHFKFGIGDTERLLRAFRIDSGDLVRAVARVENDLWNLEKIRNVQGRTRIKYHFGSQKL